MRVKIIKCSEINKWYVGLIGEEFEVDSHLYLMKGEEGLDKMKRLTGFDWTNAFILKSDCEVIDESKLELQIPPVSSINNIVIKMNGIEYDLVPKMPITSTNLKPEKKNEPELNTFEDCWADILPSYYIGNANTIERYTELSPFECKSKSKHNHLPTIKSLKQIQAAIKLFVIQHALNGGPDFKPNGFSVYFDGALLQTECAGWNNSDMKIPYIFNSMELALKSIEIGKDIWLEYFGIE